MITSLHALEAILREARAQGAADAEYEREAAKKKALKAMPSPEVLAIKKALGVPPVDRYAEEHDARLDKKNVAKLLSTCTGGGYQASADIDKMIAEIGIDRFLAACPPDVASKMRAQIRKAKAATPKAAAPKAPRRFSTEEAIIIRMRGTQAQRDALARQEAAEHPDTCHCTSCEVVKYRSRAGMAEGVRELAAATKRNRELLDGKAAEPKPEKLSQAEIDATWREAHERVARDSGRIR